MKRVLRILTVMVLVVAACGGGDDDPAVTTTVAASGDGSTTTTTTTTASTSAPVDVGSGASSEFCGFVEDYAENVEVSPLGLSTDELEPTFRSTADAIDRAADLAPGEIKGDVRLLADAYRGFIDLLAEYDFNFLAMADVDEDDPRLLALDDPALEEAGDRISAFCGMDDFIATPSDGGGSGTGGGGSLAPASLPDDFPAELAPPGGVAVVSMNIAGATSVTFDVESPTDDVIVYYSDVLGAPAVEMGEPKGALWTTEYEGSTVNVVLSEIAPGMVQVNIVIE